MKVDKYKLLFLCLIGFISSCSSGSGGEDPVLPTPDPPVVSRIPISLKCDLSASAATRATDTGYEAGDKIGLYVVNYEENVPGILSQSGNHVDNICFTYNGGVWSPESPIYWKDEDTPADFYCYYPYSTPTDITAHLFSVKEDQSVLANYKASEFLYGKSNKVFPTEQAVSLTTYHLFSCAIITVAPGNGYTEESLETANISVRLNGCKNNAAINLKEGTVDATGEATTILPLKEEKQYKALIVPQTIQADNFITVTVNGQDYNLKKEFTFVSGMRHQFTVTVNRTSNGINVGIGSWEDDGTDNGGTAE